MELPQPGVAMETSPPGFCMLSAACGCAAGRATPGSRAPARSSAGSARAPASRPARRRPPRRSCARARSSHAPRWPAPAEIAVRQQVPDRLPVHPGRFHHGMGAAAFGQPRAERQQAGRRGVEAAHLAPCPARSARRTTATTLSLCTSSPAQRGWRTCIAPPSTPPAQDAPDAKSKRRAPGPRGPWRNRGCFRRPGSN